MRLEKYEGEKEENFFNIFFFLCPPSNFSRPKEKENPI